MSSFGHKTGLIILQDTGFDLKRLKRYALAEHGCGAPRPQGEIQSITSSDKPGLDDTCFAL